MFLAAIIQLIIKDLRQAIRQGSDTAMTLAFFLIVIALFPLGIGPDPKLLRLMAGGIIWVAALLAVLLSLDRVFADDHRDGTLDVLLLSPAGALGTVLAKCAAHWLTTGLPIVVISPLMALFLNLPPATMTTLVIVLLLGTPILTMIGVAGAALVLGARRGGVLLSLLILPLYIPVLIFGTTAIAAAGNGLPVRAHLLLMGAGLLLTMALAPIAAAAALRQAAE